jgi:cobalamin-dependent methionine synthase I
MPISGLTIIGETINDSVPSTRDLFERGDIAGIQELARFQQEKGASYLDVNVGLREPHYMAEIVCALQQVVSIPLSLDTPDYEMMRAALEAYDPTKAEGRRPILNSVSALRIEILDLTRVQPSRVILMASERLEDDEGKQNKFGREVHQVGLELFHLATSPPYNLAPDDIIIDPSLAPIGADFEGLIRMALDGLKFIHEDPRLQGVHMSVGLTNFSVMLPSRRKDSSPVRLPLECAFLTLAMPLGLDHIVGSVRKNYQLLPDDHPALLAVKEAIALEGFDSIQRIQEFYR